MGHTRTQHCSKQQLYSIASSARAYPRRGRAAASFDHLSCLLADFGSDDIAEQFPTLALEFPELKLLDRSEVSRAGVYRYAGQEIGRAHV